MICLDNDLGGGSYLRGKYGDGIDVAKYTAEKKLHTDTLIIVHTCNTVGGDNIIAALANTHKNVSRIPHPYLVEILAKVGKPGLREV